MAADRSVRRQGAAGDGARRRRARSSRSKASGWSRRPWSSFLVTLAAANFVDCLRRRVTRTIRMTCAGANGRPARLRWPARPARRRWRCSVMPACRYPLASLDHHLLGRIGLELLACRRSPACRRARSRSRRPWAFRCARAAVTRSPIVSRSHWRDAAQDVQDKPAAGRARCRSARRPTAAPPWRRALRSGRPGRAPIA